MELTEYHPNISKQEELYTKVLPDADRVMKQTTFDLENILDAEIDWGNVIGNHQE